MSRRVRSTLKPPTVLGRVVRTANAVGSLIDPPQTAALAVSYLRVSTKEQAEKGGTDEGSPSRPSVKPTAARPNRSARSSWSSPTLPRLPRADRPELIPMIQYVKTHRVTYCVVHKVNRLARNRADDVAIHLALQDAGVMLDSATEIAVLLAQPRLRGHQGHDVEGCHRRHCWQRAHRLPQRPPSTAERAAHG